jgi:hypothetical protein
MYVCMHVCLHAPHPAHASVCARVPVRVRARVRLRGRVSVCVRLSLCVCLCVGSSVCWCVAVSVHPLCPAAPAVINAANALCSSTSSARRVRPAKRIRARQRRRRELPVGNGQRAWSSRVPESGGPGGEAARRQCSSRWSAGGVLLAHSRCRKLLLQHRTRPKQRLRSARVRRCARVLP